MDRTPCRTPAEGRDGVTNIPTWKFEALRTAILKILATGPCRWSELTEKVHQELSDDELANMGKLGWHVIGVKLELEVRNEIKRLAQPGPQVISLT